MKDSQSWCCVLECVYFITRLIFHGLQKKMNPPCPLSPAPIWDHPFHNRISITFINQWRVLWIFTTIKLDISFFFLFLKKNDSLHNSIYRSLCYFLFLDYSQVFFFSVPESRCSLFCSRAHKICLQRAHFVLSIFLHVSDRDKRRRLRVVNNSIFQRLFNYRPWELQHALQRPAWEELVNDHRTKFHDCIAQSEFMRNFA